MPDERPRTTHECPLTEAVEEALEWYRNDPKFNGVGHRKIFEKLRFALEATRRGRR